MALSALFVLVCAVSFNWAKWGDYRTCKEVEYDIEGGKAKYCKKGKGCPKGYLPGGTEDSGYTCTKCKKAEVVDPENGEKIKYSDFCKKLGDLKAKELADDNKEKATISCYCKNKKVKAGSCPAVAKQESKNRDDYCKEEDNKSNDECKSDYYKKFWKNCKKDKNYDGSEYKGCKEGYIKEGRAQAHYQGCMLAGSKGRVSYWAVWAFILAIALGSVGVLAIVGGVVVVVLMMGKKKAPVDPNPSSQGNNNSHPKAQPVPEQQPDGAPENTADKAVQEEEVAPEQQAAAAAAAPAPVLEELEESESG